MAGTLAIDAANSPSIVTMADASRGAVEIAWHLCISLAPKKWRSKRTKLAAFSSTNWKSALHAAEIAGHHVPFCDFNGPRFAAQNAARHRVSRYTHRQVLVPDSCRRFSDSSSWSRKKCSAQTGKVCPVQLSYEWFSALAHHNSNAMTPAIRASYIAYYKPGS